MPGGRPKNSWKPGRERKLVRLYILSNLNLVEIRKVLTTRGFDPSTSDMQKKLRALLPKDYARDYRRYRPSSHQNARRRLFHVKLCTNDRIKKYRGSRSPMRVAPSYETSLRAAGSSPEAMEIQTSAFRNQSCSSSTGPCDYISISSLDLPNIQLDAEKAPDYDAVDYSRRLQKLRHEGAFNTTLNLRGVQYLPAVLPTMHIKSAENIAMSINDDKQVGELEYRSVWRQKLFPRIDTGSTGGHEVETSSVSLSISSLGRRLARRYSQSTIEHIASILRSSSTSSRRSSLLSLISFASSKPSSKISIDQISSTSENKPAKSPPKGPKFLLRRGKVLLTDDEQKVWEALVDESQLAQASREIPSYPEISLVKRACCEMSVFPSCKQCVFSEAHRWAVTSVKEPSASVPFPNGLSSEFAQDRNHFGNTPLHFVVANATGSATTGWRTMQWLICKGANVRARDTSGETFMHVLRREQLKNTERYAELLLSLAPLEFPFSQRDSHGQTLAEIFFTTVNPQDIPLHEFSIIFSHLLFDINVKYCAEFWRQTANDSNATKEDRSNGARHLATMVAQGYRPLPSFQSENFWSRRLGMSDIAKEVDVNGDSALVYIVKAWREKHDERQLAHIISSLVTAGAEISMRDKWGDTALAIAARRGLRPAVKALLGHGANPNTRNYHGRGIISQARECLRRAKYEDKGRRYAMILSCITLLTDFGAKEDPTAYDEFISPTALAKIHRSPGIV